MHRPSSPQVTHASQEPKDSQSTGPPPLPELALDEVVADDVALFVLVLAVLAEDDDALLSAELTGPDAAPPAPPLGPALRSGTVQSRPHPKPRAHATKLAVTRISDRKTAIAKCPSWYPGPGMERAANTNLQRPLSAPPFLCEIRPVPWVRAQLKGQTVYARANERGGLHAPAGRVEVRYRPNDGRAYQASLANLSIVDATLLPDDTCADAERAPRMEVAPSGEVRRRASGPSSKARDAAKKAQAKEGVAPPRPGAVVAYTDGACSGNPGPAGLGVVVTDGERWVERSEFLGEGTNNIAELTAILRALEEVSDVTRAMDVHTDSQYAIGVLQKGWRAKANQTLIANLRSQLAHRTSVRLVYVPGHAGVPLNERADELARLAVQHRASQRVERAAPPKEPS